MRGCTGKAVAMRSGRKLGTASRHSAARKATIAEVVNPLAKPAND